MPLHKKIIVPDAAVGHEVFADWYRFGADLGGAMPLVVYFGGAISTATYEARRDTEPSPIRELFEFAIAETGLESVDLLVIPCPLIGRSEVDFRARIFSFVLDELLPRTPNPEPARVAFFGNSAGAHLAAMLAFESETVRVLATTAGVGMADAAMESERRLFAGKRYLCFANDDDPCTPYTHAFWEEMLSHGVAVDVIERAGGHAFDDYVANGSARECFVFAIEALR
jgi:hypothetical protein